MLTANVATAKNELSRLLRHVKRGESVLITERNRPVATLQSVVEAGTDSQNATLCALYESGVLSLPSGAPLTVTSFLAAPRAVLAESLDLRSAILAERAEER